MEGTANVSCSLIGTSAKAARLFLLNKTLDRILSLKRGLETDYPGWFFCHQCEGSNSPLAIMTHIFISVSQKVLVCLEAYEHLVCCKGQLQTENYLFAKGFYYSN